MNSKDLGFETNVRQLNSSPRLRINSKFEVRTMMGALLNRAVHFFVVCIKPDVRLSVRLNSPIYIYTST